MLSGKGPCRAHEPACSAAARLLEGGGAPLDERAAGARGGRGWPLAAEALSLAAEALSVVACCALFEAVAHSRYCGLLFRCGCTWPWAGGAADCNVHNPSGPKCPWCNVAHTSLAWLAPAISSQATVLVMVCAYAGAAWYQSRRRSPFFNPSIFQLVGRAAAAVCAFFAAGLVLAWVFYAWSTPAYPCFLWVVDAETHCGGKA